MFFLVFGGLNPVIIAIVDKMTALPTKNIKNHIKIVTNNETCNEQLKTRIEVRLTP
ncbi:hypothetical protein NBRC111894_3567 [Sporolactobacillus inulinus]|uniref:Uncharacterized protein n=1 Tax=Sporolactobacillus inulinus TaxID=2078 RepID=A0A4Y1ZGA7_9BACL|nr:hypothetical protein NBRC111894_3567 [Sporolactobacillus inulinus]